MLARTRTISLLCVLCLILAAMSACNVGFTAKGEASYSTDSSTASESTPEQPASASEQPRSQEESSVTSTERTTSEISQPSSPSSERTVVTDEEDSGISHRPTPPGHERNDNAPSEHSRSIHNR